MFQNFSFRTSALGITARRMLYIALTSATVTTSAVLADESTLNIRTPTTDAKSNFSWGKSMLDSTDVKDKGITKLSADESLRTEAADVLAAKPASSTKSEAEEKEDDTPDQLRVLTFNIAIDGLYGIDGVINMIKNSNADVVGLQESEKVTERIAKEAGYKYVQKSGHGAILTKLDIDGITPGGDGIVTHTAHGHKVAFFDKHLFYKPYQPYQLLGIPYENAPFIKTEQEAVSEATKARGKDVDDVRKDIASLNDPNLPTILVGDFNEPSHLDWTDKAAKAGRHPIKVEWPASKAFADDGFKDSYRELNPDEIAKPGYTWTPTTKNDDPKDHHDRIDFVLYRGKGIKAKEVDVIGENNQNSDIVVAPYPSDHRAVYTVFEVGKRGN